MKDNSNPLNTILLVILALIVADIFMNDGRIMAGIAANADDTTAVYSIDTSAPVTISTATPGTSGLTNFTVIDTSEPEIIDLVPVLPTQGPATQQPEAIIDYAEVIAQPTATPHALSDEQLLACLRAQQDGRRMAPYCPTNAAELLGEGR